MRGGALVVVVAGLMISGLFAYDRFVQMRRMARVEEDLARVVAENRLRAPGEGPRASDPPDLATWAAQIDRMVQESYGELLRLSLSESQIRGIVKSLEERVASPGTPDLADPAVRAGLREAVDGLISEHLYERGLILKRKTPTADEVAGKVGLESEQRAGFDRIFADTRGAIVDLARERMPHNVDLLADLYRLENVPWASSERGVLEWKLLSTELSGGRTFQGWLSEQERIVTSRLAGVLTADQMARFQFLKLVPWDLVGIALQTREGQ